MVGPTLTKSRRRIVVALRAIVTVVALVLVASTARRARADDAGTSGAATDVTAIVDAGAGALALVDAAPPPLAPSLALDAGVPPPVDAAPAPRVPVDAAAAAPAPPVPDDAGAHDGGSPVPDDAGPATTVPVDAAPAIAVPVDAGPAATTVTRPIAPTIDEPPSPPAPRARTGNVIKLVLGLAAVFVLAYIGGDRRVVALERRLGISGAIAAGFPMIALGLALRQPAIGILTDDVLGRLQPILHFGLGWLGFIIGAQLDIRLLDRVPRGTAYVVIVEALGPFILVAATCAGLALALQLSDWHDPDFWRDAIILGTAAAMTAPRHFRGFARQTWREGKGVDHLIAQLDEIFGVIGLLFIAAFFRTDAGAWEIPGTAWLFVAIGIGVVVGVLFFAMIRVPATSGELLAVVLGSVAFGSGLAGYLDLSPTVVCFIAGALVTNFPGERKRDVFAILMHLERPINLLFLVLAGASWDASAAAPWLLVPAFAIARVLGKWIAVVFAGRTIAVRLPDGFADDRTLVSPLSPLSIALVLSLQGSAGGAPTPWLLTIVIGAAMLTEVVVQLTAPPAPRATTRPVTLRPPPIDELDDAGDDADDADDASPVHRDDAPDEASGEPGRAPPAPSKGGPP